METVVRRHKTLGAWVPRWVAGPCHNPACAACDEQGAVRHTLEGTGQEAARPARGAAPPATTPPGRAVRADGAD